MKHKNCHIEVDNYLTAAPLNVRPGLLNLFSATICCRSKVWLSSPVSYNKMAFQFIAIHSLLVIFRFLCVADICGQSLALDEAFSMLGKGKLEKQRY